MGNYIDFYGLCLTMYYMCWVFTMVCYLIESNGISR